MILEDLKIEWDESIRLYCDIKLMIKVAQNSAQYNRTKHTEVDRHFSKKKLDSGSICTPYMSTILQRAKCQLED